MCGAADFCRMFSERYGIMEMIRTYILSVSYAAMICAICKRLLSEHTPTSSLCKSLIGLFLLFSVLSPLRSISLHKPSFDLSELQQQAQDAVNAGTEQVQTVLRESITGRIKTYIEEQGRALGAEILVEVALSDDPIPVPVMMHIYGDISPYAKSQLRQIIENNIGIPKENQLWH